MFKTSVITLSSGAEQRNQEWSVVRGAWDIAYGIRDREHFEEVIAFFYARRGRHRGFRFKDWSDYQATLEVVGTTGNVLTRQLQKTYQDTVLDYTRKIVLPVSATLIVYVDDIATLDYVLGANGLLTFPGDPGGNVKATFEFDVPARFDTDQLITALEWVNAASQPNIPIVELKAD